MVFVGLCWGPPVDGNKHSAPVMAIAKIIGIFRGSRCPPSAAA